MHCKPKIFSHLCTQCFYFIFSLSVFSLFSFFLSVPRSVSYDPYDERVKSGQSNSSSMQSKEYLQCNEDWASVQRSVKDVSKERKS